MAKGLHSPAAAQPVAAAPTMGPVPEPVLLAASPWLLAGCVSKGPARGAQARLCERISGWGTQIFQCLQRTENCRACLSLQNLPLKPGLANPLEMSEHLSQHLSKASQNPQHFKAQSRLLTPFKAPPSLCKGLRPLPNLQELPEG